MSDSASPSGDFKAPNWIENVDAALSFCSQFVLSGNIRDLQSGPAPRGPWERPLIECLWDRLEMREYRYLLIYNTTGGLRLLPRTAATEVAAALAPLNSQASALARGEFCPWEKARLSDLVQAVYESPMRGALVIENGSRLAASAQNLTDDELRMFSECERLLRAAEPHPGGTVPNLLFNPVFWLVDRPADLPSWLVAAGERSRSIAVPLPDGETRAYFAYRQGRVLTRDAPVNDLFEATRLFARQSEGMRLSEMAAVAQIAAERSLTLDKIGDAIRAYKVGSTDDPWRKPFLRDDLRRGDKKIREWLKGQDEAVAKTLDILKRAALGMSGAQASSSIGRPRGVLFFAGPTGVGKTQLAKAIGELIFGSPDNIIRFDMAEYSAEHSEARLIGAPPGYLGHEQGGALVNAVRDRPFSVLLFDEIEKAHPRILDKFLQILEDGRLTDGRGETVYFSEAIIIFTSNLGVSTREGDTVTQNVRPGDPYEQVRATIEAGVHRYFHEALQRPELLNRIGTGNIIVFDFIDEKTAREIFKSNLAAIVKRVASILEIELTFTPQAQQALEDRIVANRDYGGRGIGNEMEIQLINPLARALFDRNFLPGESIAVSVFASGTGAHKLELSPRKEGS